MKRQTIREVINGNNKVSIERSSSCTGSDLSKESNKYVRVQMKVTFDFTSPHSNKSH